MNLMTRLWNDEAGFVVSSELTLIATILVLGVIVGLTSIRDSLVQELGDLAGAIGAINQSYSFSAVTGHHSSTAGSFLVDLLDDCDVVDNGQGTEPQCIEVCATNASSEG